MKNWQQRQREMGWAWQKQQEKLAGEDFGPRRSSKWFANIIWLIIVGVLIAYLLGALK